MSVAEGWPSITGVTVAGASAVRVSAVCWAALVAAPAVRRAATVAVAPPPRRLSNSGLSATPAAEKMATHKTSRLAAATTCMSKVAQLGPDLAVGAAPGTGNLAGPGGAG